MIDRFFQTLISGDFGKSICLLNIWSRLIQQINFFFFFFFFKNIFPSCLFYLLSININEVSKWKMCSVGDGKEGK